MSLIDQCPQDHEAAKAWLWRKTDDFHQELRREDSFQDPGSLERAVKEIYAAHRLVFGRTWEHRS